MSENHSPPHAWFTDGQRRLIATAIAALAAVVLAAVIFFAVYALGLFITAFGHVIWPLAIAGILTALLRPLVNNIERKLNLSRTKAVVLLYFLVIVACVILGAVLLPLLVTQLIELTRTIPEFIKHVYHYLKDTLDNYPELSATLKGYLDENALAQAQSQAIDSFNSLLDSAPAALLHAGSTLRHFFEVAAAVAVIPIYLFFLLKENHNFTRDIKEHLSFLHAPLRQDLVFLAGEFSNIVVSFFQGQLLIGLIMGILKAIGFTLIGIHGGFILGLVFGLLNVVPYLGTILGLAVVLPIAYFQPDGGWVLALEAVGVFAVVQACEAYYITPKIMGHRTGLHPMIIILSIFFWGEALHGILGMILAVPLTAFLVVVWRLLKTKYLPRPGHTKPIFVKPAE
jgi:predicted PurR-regulated permease PerM